MSAEAAVILASAELFPPTRRTLAEWCAAADVHHTHPTTERGAVSVCIGADNPYLLGAWELTDYRVDSRSGPVIWFVPFSKPRPGPAPLIRDCLSP